jgi:hypothetical protein
MGLRGRDGQVLATQADSRGGEHGMVPSEEVGILDHYAGGIALYLGTVGGPDTSYHKAHISTAGTMFQRLVFTC